MVKLASVTRPEDYTCILMQGSGTFSVEATIGSVIPENGKLLVLANDVYGDRLVEISVRIKIDHEIHDTGELSPPDLKRLDDTLANDPSITHVDEEEIVEKFLGQLLKRWAGNEVRPLGFFDPREVCSSRILVMVSPRLVILICREKEAESEEWVLSDGIP